LFRNSSLRKSPIFSSISSTPPSRLSAHEEHLYNEPWREYTTKQIDIIVLI
jgi:hypothetical protein